MATAHSPRKTRAQTLPPAATETVAGEGVTLRALLEEVRAMREDHARREATLTERLQRQEEELLRLRSVQPQLSLSNFNASGEPDARRECNEERDGRVTLGFKLMPDTYDGSAPLSEFFTQFELIARANVWDDATKTVALASSLRGPARSVLETVPDVAKLEFNELKRKLELRFSEGRSSHNFYTQFTNRQQNPGEDLAALGVDLERLSRLAYPECSYEVREKIACAQFISAIMDEFTKRTLQLENITSLSTAVERAKTIGIIRGIHSEDYRGQFPIGFSKNSGDYLVRKETGNPRRETSGEKGDRNSHRDRRASKPNGGKRECWTCGKVGHFRVDCPNAKGHANDI